MAESVRLEIAFEGDRSITATVPAEAAEALERALSAAGDGDDEVFALEASDGRYLVVLRRVLFLRRPARDSRIGFGGF